MRLRLHFDRGKGFESARFVEVAAGVADTGLMLTTVRGYDSPGFQIFKEPTPFNMSI